MTKSFDDFLQANIARSLVTRPSSGELPNRQFCTRCQKWIHADMVDCQPCEAATPVWSQLHKYTDAPNILACDPGVGGGFASLTHGIETPRLMPMPTEKKDIIELLRWTCDANTVVFIEAVQGFIGAAHPGSRMFTFGFNAGLIEGCALGLKLEVVRVPPQVWQGWYNFKETSRSVGKAAWKKFLKKHAESLYPTLKVTRATADALLLLHYAINK